MTERVSRRAFVGRAALALAAHNFALRPVWALTEPSSLAGPSSLAEPSSPLVKRVVRSPENTYYTYPHSNGFLPNGACVLASPTSGPENPGLDYLSFDFNNGNSWLIAHVRDPRMYYAIGRNGMMAVPRRNGMYLIDTTRKNDRPRSLFDDADWRVHADCDISADGSKILVTLTRNNAPDRHRASVIDVASGNIETMMETDWLIDHAHFSPFDRTWVVFANAQPNNYRRLWVWNRKQAPQGRMLFKQVQSDGKVFDIGHERAMFNERTVLVIAFGSHSSARPCGLYAVGFDGEMRLVSESMRDLHCNVSQDGLWAVVSLQGTHETLMQRISRDWLTEGPGYGFSDVMIVNLSTGARQFLYRATNATQGQPYEVQPTISPDGKWVLLKDAREKRVLGIEIDQPALAAFLKRTAA